MRPLCGHKTGNPLSYRWSTKKHRRTWKDMRAACLRALKRRAKGRDRAELRREFALPVRC